MTFWRSLLQTIAKNPISLFAVLCVAATAAFLGVLTYRLLVVLESPAWCAKAIQAEKVTPGDTYVGLTTCVELLKIQLSAVATGFHISTGGFVFVLIVLIVVVVAGARASGKVGAGGLEFDMSRQDAAAAGAAAAADHVVEGAEQAAAEVKS
jgi:hypothetical protein